jgi:hypothetical protein
MGKIFVGILIGAVLVGAVLGVFGLVNAQSPVNPFQQGQQPGYGMMGNGNGMMGGRGAGMMGQAYAAGQTGPMHDLMIAAWADELDLGVDEISQRITDGETLYDIALSTGMTAEAFQAARVEIHAAVLEQAVAQGLITQEQADWMQSRGARMGAGGCAGGMRQGRWGNVAPQVNP